MSIAVVDYGMGNRRSVEKALEHVGTRVSVTRDHDKLRAAEGLVVPGVGAFPTGMAKLDQLGLATVLKESVQAGTPILGICLGMQLLFDRSEEIEPTEGLGLIPGEVTHLHAPSLPVPHIGWSHVDFLASSPLTQNLPAYGSAFYHVHSLVARPKLDGHVVGTTEYGERFATIVAHEHIFGVQFHPEKSSAGGLKLLENFVTLCGARAFARA